MVEDLNPAAAGGDAHGVRTPRRSRIDEPERSVGQDPEVRDGVRARIDDEKRVPAVGERHGPLGPEACSCSVTPGGKAANCRLGAAAIH